MKIFILLFNALLSFSLTSYAGQNDCQEFSAESLFNAFHNEAFGNAKFGANLKNESINTDVIAIRVGGEKIIGKYMGKAVQIGADGIPKNVIRFEIIDEFGKPKIILVPETEIFLYAKPPPGGPRQSAYAGGAKKAGTETPPPPQNSQTRRSNLEGKAAEARANGVPISEQAAQEAGIRYNQEFHAFSGRNEYRGTFLYEDANSIHYIDETGKPQYLNKSRIYHVEAMHPEDIAAFRQKNPNAYYPLIDEIKIKADQARSAGLGIPADAVHAAGVTEGAPFYAFSKENKYSGKFLYEDANIIAYKSWDGKDSILRKDRIAYVSKMHPGEAGRYAPNAGGAAAREADNAAKARAYQEEVRRENIRREAEEARARAQREAQERARKAEERARREAAEQAERVAQEKAQQAIDQASRLADQSLGKMPASMSEAKRIIVVQPGETARSAYLRMVRENHPDRLPMNASQLEKDVATEKMKRINAAFEWLKSN